MATTLSGLSPEIIIMIASLLPDNDLVCFCQTSRYHAAILESLMEARQLLEFEDRLGFNMLTEDLEAEGFRLLTMDFMESGRSSAGLPEFWKGVKKEDSISRAIEERMK